MSQLENRIPPPLVALTLAIGMFGLSWVNPVVDVQPVVRLIVAAIGIGTGFALTSRGFFKFRRAGTTIDPIHVDAASALVTTGIYRYTRNPMYVGFTTMLLGWAAYLAAPWALVGPLGFVLFINRYQIVPEERALLAKFGADYEAYRAQVRRWL